jgi:hypothetical protein
MDSVEKLFYHDKYFILGFNKFYEKVKMNNIDISKADLLKFYNSQEISQRFKPKIHKSLKIAKSNIPFERVYCDTMFITDLNISLLSFIDMFTKYAFVFPFKISKQLKSSVSASCLKKVDTFALDKGFSIIDIVCDNGSEFLGDFKKKCDDLDISINYASPGDKRKTSPIESFNRTLRSMIEKYRIVRRVDASNVFKVIKDIQDVYNNSYHNSIKNYPINMFILTKIVSPVISKNKESKLLKGDKVRIYIKDENNKFQKLKPLWSKEIYTIKAFRNGYYSLEEINDLFTYSNIQKIHKHK